VIPLALIVMENHHKIAIHVNPTISYLVNNHLVISNVQMDILIIKILKHAMLVQLLV